MARRATSRRALPGTRPSNGYRVGYMDRTGRFVIPLSSRAHESFTTASRTSQIPSTGAGSTRRPLDLETTSRGKPLALAVSRNFPLPSRARERVSGKGFPEHLHTHDSLGVEMRKKTLVVLIAVGASSACWCSRIGVRATRACWSRIARRATPACGCLSASMGARASSTRTAR